MKKGIISIFVALSMTLMLLNTLNISAAETTTECPHTDWQEISTFPTSGGNYILTNDITLGGTITADMGTVNICLNGHNMTSSYYVINIERGAVLNLYDCKGTAKLTCNNGCCIRNNGTLNMYGGNITGSNDLGVFNNGIFNMYGGKITNNNNTVNFSVGFNGGGVHNQNIFNMYDGEISNNTAYFVGGGVFNTGVFNMSGGKIINNKANSNGGGVSVSNPGSSFTMSGGEISGNTAVQYGGGICLTHSNAKLNVSGKITVFDNIGNGKAENIYMDGLSDVISIINPLDNKSKLGIANYTIGYCMDSEIFTVTSANTTDYSSCFVSDNPEYEIISEESNGNYFIKLRMPHEYDETVWYYNERSHYNFCTQCLSKLNNAEHIEDDGTVTVPATTGNEGVKTYACEVCGYVMRTVTIPKLDEEQKHTHSFSPDWKHDVTNHWHECGCGEKSELAGHVSSDWIVETPATAYVEGVQIKVCTVCGAELERTVLEKLPNSGSIAEYVQDTAGTNARLVQDNTLIENVLTPEDRAAVENGSSFEIVLKVTDIQSSVPAADMAAASSVLRYNEKIGIYVDLSLFKIKDNIERSPIYNTGGQIGITLIIPESIYASDRTYSIIRVHNGTAENLGGTYDKENRRLTFYTDKFSTYAIAYTVSDGSTDKPPVPSTPPTGDITSVSPSVPVGTPTITEAAAKEEDGILIVIFASVLGIAVIAAKKHICKI